jgi:hypothetical protein
MGQEKMCTMWDKQKESQIAHLVYLNIKQMKEFGFKVSGGFGDKLFRIFNRHIFNIPKEKQCEPSSKQRNFVESLYPDIYLKNQKKVKNGTNI